MQDVVSTFFEGLGGPHPEVPETISGRLRFDLEDGGRVEHWMITFDRGTVGVDRTDTRADCIVRTSKATMAAIIEGSTNPMASTLRGTFRVEGQSLLVVVFRVLLPAPIRAPEPVAAGRRPS